MFASLRTTLTLAPLVLAATAAAQDPFLFTIDQPQSAWTWSGTTSLGPLVGNPGNTFNLSGTMLATLAATTHPLGTGQMVGSNADVLPDISAVIPNPVSFLPPLATIDISNLTLSFASDPFAIDAAGNFTTMVTVTALSGLVTVTPLTGSVTMTDLTGNVSDPQQVSGTVTQAGATLQFVSALTSQFTFMDAASGISATLNLAGTLAGDADCPAPTAYCQASPNSVGPGALMAHSGSTSLFADDLVFVANGVPNQPGIFFYGPDQASIPFGNGMLCVGGQLVRFDPTTASGNTLSAPMDYAPPAPVRSGATFHFQAWYRDPVAGGAFFNLSDGLTVTFCP
ncbi:MAG: hypothetical protein E2O39_12650 [Planctomycetota bacterium]|nr:MAG: hypothetical protein E2O39_12650 [Planctomycetota bacterium]